jgi:hypothetical protein
MDLGPLQRITERLWCGQARIMELEPARSGSYRKTAKNVFPYSTAEATCQVSELGRCDRRHRCVLRFLDARTRNGTDTSRRA